MTDFACAYSECRMNRINISISGRPNSFNRMPFESDDMGIFYILSKSMAISRFLII